MNVQCLSEDPQELADRLLSPEYATDREEQIEGLVQGALTPSIELDARLTIVEALSYLPDADRHLAYIASMDTETSDGITVRDRAFDLLQ